MSDDKANQSTCKIVRVHFEHEMSAEASFTFYFYAFCRRKELKEKVAFHTSIMKFLESEELLAHSSVREAYK